mgnify:CR=1 FL=1
MRTTITIEDDAFAAAQSYARARFSIRGVAPVPSPGGSGSSMTRFSTTPNRALIQALVAEARAQGVHVIVGCVSGENRDAIAFHARLGFRVGLDQYHHSHRRSPVFVP